MTLKPDITAAIQEAALAAGLPISIVRGVVCTESSGNPEATRWEPGFYDNYIKGKFPDDDYHDEHGRAVSWGLMQIMGQVARERGFRGKFNELLQPEVGLYWGCRQLNVLHARYFKKHGWAGVIAAYNAGSPRKVGGKFANQGYVDKVLKYAAGKG